MNDTLHILCRLAAYCCRPCNSMPNLGSTLNKKEFKLEKAEARYNIKEENK